MPAPYNHPSGLPAAYDRSSDFPDWRRLIFRERRFIQGAELNELQTILENRGARVGDLTAKDGDRVEGCDIIVDVGAESVTLATGKVYVRGDVRAIGSATLTSVPMTGDVYVGVRIVKTTITELDEPALLGLHPGTLGEGEAGAAREVEAIAWGFSGDGETGDLYSVYALRNGVVIDQTPPPNLSGINNAIAIYDRDAHGSYVVSGCNVRALGNISGSQHFAIAEGVANINGFKRTRQVAIRHIEAEAPDTKAIAAEPHTFADGGSGTAVITFNHPPKSALSTCLVEKEKTVTVTKGTGGGQDSLPDTSILSLVEVKQGGTTYVATTDYTLTADKVNWSPAGAEPSPGSSYTVKYRYLAVVSPASSTDTTVTLTGGVTGGTVLISYSYKLPRVDLLCLDEAGNSIYIKGISSDRPRPPQTPSTLLLLATVTNNWMDRPTINNVEIRSIKFDELWHYMSRLFDALDLIALERLKRDIDSREPVAKKGIFVDPFVDDFYRDAGELPQTAALANGFMRLAIDPAFFSPTMSSAICLDYTEEVIIRQEKVTSCRLVNPYQNFDPLPGIIELTPGVDFWTVKETDWLSPNTSEWTGRFKAGVTSVELGMTEAEVLAIRATPMRTVDGVSHVHTPVTQTSETLVGTRSQPLETLRSISVAFTIRGFANGETLSALTFDGLNVKPAGTQTANSSGVITGYSFTIPAGVTAGTKLVEATGSTGRKAWATFTGQGTVEIETRQRTTRKITLIDPVAQTLTLTEKRHVLGFDIKFCAKGDATKPCVLELRTVENGIPTGNVLASKRIDMASVVVDAWTEVRFDFPVFLTDDREFCFAILTDDPVHAIATAQIGQQDEGGEYVGAQPYSVGVMLTSSNASTWTPHQTEDVAFRCVAAVFAPTTKSVALGSFAVTNMSDVVIRGNVDLPTEAADFYFELERAGGEIIKLLPGQSQSFDSFITETVQLRAILKGSSKISPILYPGVLMVVGTIRTSGTYISRAFDMGTAIRTSTTIKAFLPSGSDLTVEVDAADDAWVSVAQFSSVVLNDYWTEREFRKTPYTAVEGRIRLTLTGTPAARPLLSDFRSVAI